MKSAARCCRREASGNNGLADRLAMSASDIASPCPARDYDRLTRFALTLFIFAFLDCEGLEKVL